MGSILFKGGAGGGAADSSELTTKASDVLKGKSYVGNDTNDEVGTGTLDLSAKANATATQVLKDRTFFTNNNQLPSSPLKGTMANVGALETTSKVRVNGNNLVLGMTNGAHITNGGSGTTGVPEVQTAFSNVASKMGITAAKIADGVTISGVKGTYKGKGNAVAGDVLSGKTFSTASLSGVAGTMPNRGAYQYAGGFGSGTDNKGEYVAFNNMPVGYYSEDSSNSSWAPEVRMLKKDFLNYVGITADKIAYGSSIMGIAGTGLPGGQSLSVNDIFVPGAIGSGYSTENFSVFPTTWPNYGGYDPNAMAWKVENRGDYIYIRTQGGENVEADKSGVFNGCWSINKIIPNTNGIYKSITVVISGCAGMTNVYNQYPFGLCISPTLALEDAGNLAYYRLGKNDLSDRGVQKTITLDISNVTQSFYISFWFNHGYRTVGNAQWQADCYIHRISLTRK